MKMLVSPTFTATTEATAEAQAKLPVPQAAVVPLAELRHVMAHYTRHFTGQERVLCDPVHLNELIARLEGIRARLAALPQATAMAPHLILLSRHLTLLTYEEALVRVAGEGQPAQERVGWLATRLDRVIARYQTLCEGRPRLSRRPGLLPRMIGSLDRLADEMTAPELLALDDPDHRANGELVEALRVNFAAEAEAVAAERAQASPESLSDALAEEAQDGLDMWRLDFAARERGAWNAEHLSRVCDRLGEVEQQLIPLAAMSADPILAQAVKAVQMQLDSCERVHEQLRRGGIPGGEMPATES